MGNSHAQGPQIFNVFETAAAFFFFFSFLQKDRNRTNTVGMFNKCQKLKTSSDSIRAQRKGSKKTKLGTQISLATGWSQSQRRTTAPGTNLLCSLLLLLWFLCFKKKKSSVVWSPLNKWIRSAAQKAVQLVVVLLLLPVWPSPDF